MGARSAAPYWAAPGDPASATDPGQPALAPRQGRAKLGWAGIDRRSDKTIDFCAEKLIDLLLALGHGSRPRAELGTRRSREAVHPGPQHQPEGGSQPLRPVGFMLGKGEGRGVLGEGR